MNTSMACHSSCVGAPLPSLPFSPHSNGRSPRLPTTPSSLRLGLLLRHAPRCHTPPHISYCLPHHQRIASDTSVSSVRKSAASPASISILGPSPLLRCLWREVHISYRFIHYDLASTLLPGMLAALVTHLTTKAPPPLWISLAKSLIITWLTLYHFTLANQFVGVAEDVRNKPTRPIPSGLVTADGALTRLLALTPLLLTLGYSFRVGPHMAACALLTFLLNFSSLLRGRWHWLAKPLFMVASSFTLVAMNAEVVRHSQSKDLFYCAALAIAFGVGSSLQDLRDVEGDRHVRRMTLPLLVGEDLAGRICALLCMSVWGIMHFSITHLAGTAGTPLKPLMTSAIIGVWCFLLSRRAFYLRGAKENHHTYMIFLYHFSFLIIVPLWIP